MVILYNEIAPDSVSKIIEIYEGKNLTDLSTNLMMMVVDKDVR